MDFNQWNIEAVFKKKISQALFFLFYYLATFIFPRLNQTKTLLKVLQQYLSVHSSIYT